VLELPRRIDVVDAPDQQHDDREHADQKIPRIPIDGISGSDLNAVRCE
jgi:hypothetical protein